ncbi:hypothetical protein JCM3765_006270 [Sporobolomyces pararoseus]
MTRDALADILARSVTNKYASLPPNGKPRPRTNGSPSWTVLAGFSLYRSTGETTEAHCVSIGTGLKAIPHSKLPRHGDVLHDSHAEVIARRGFKLWLYRQLETAIEGGEETFLEKEGEGNWRLKGDWKLGLWISTLPCMSILSIYSKSGLTGENCCTGGDASTFSLSLSASSSSAPPTFPTSDPRSSTSETTIHASLDEAAALGLITTRSPSLKSPETSLSSQLDLPVSTPLVRRGRVSYSSFSTLRTKPGRADSLPTTSHSCSDKIALWSLLGVQGGLLSTLGVHVQLSLISVSGVKGNEEEREKVRGEIRRAVGGRLEEWRGPQGERVKVPEIGLSKEVEFEHSREVVARSAGVKEDEVVSCQESISWVEGCGTEVITNGIRQGSSSKRKEGEALGPKARSRLSKLNLFQRHLEIQMELSSITLEQKSYYEVKHSPNSNDYQRLKAAVRDGTFGGWLVSGSEWESFDSQGRLAQQLKDSS